MGAKHELVKIKLTPAQRRLIHFNISQSLNSNYLSVKHGRTFNNLEERGIFIIDDHLEAKFTNEARRRLLSVGIDINGNEAIKALRLDPVFLEYRRCEKRWDNHCLKSHGRSLAERKLHEKLTNEIFEKFQDSVINAECVFSMLRRCASGFIKTIRIPRTI